MAERGDDMNTTNINVVSRGFEIQSEEGEVLGFKTCILAANREMHEIRAAVRVVRIPDGAVCTKKRWIEGGSFWSRLWNFKESA